MDIITRHRLVKALKERIRQNGGHVIKVSNPELPEYLGVFRHHTFTFFHVGDWKTYDHLVNGMGYFVVNISSMKQLEKSFSKIEEKLYRHDAENLDDISR